MTPAEVELLPKVAEVVGWSDDFPMHWTGAGWTGTRDASSGKLTAGSTTRHMSHDYMSDRMARRIADWIDGQGLRYEREAAVGNDCMVWIDDQFNVGSTRLEAEMRAVLAWKEANP